MSRRSDYRLGEQCKDCGLEAKTERCSNCGTQFLPGLHSRSCTDCRKLLCINCRVKYNGATVCASCWIRREDHANSVPRPTQ